MCRQTAGSNAGTAKAHSRAWWKLPRRIWGILGVLGAWSLANGRLERPKNRGLEQQGQRLCARKRQVATLAQHRHRLTATGLGGTAKAHRRAWWKLPRRIWGLLGVAGVWSLANGRLERPKNRGLEQQGQRLYARKRQVALEQHRLTATGLGKLPRRIWGLLGVLGVWSLANGRLERPKNRGLEQQGQRLCARRRQVATLAQHMLTATGLGGTAKAHSRAWWKLPRGIWSVLGVLGVWSLANGRLERPKNRGLEQQGQRLCARKRQVALDLKHFRH